MRVKDCVSSFAQRSVVPLPGTWLGCALVLLAWEAQAATLQGQKEVPPTSRGQTPGERIFLFQDAPAANVSDDDGADEDLTTGQSDERTTPTTQLGPRRGPGIAVDLLAGIGTPVGAAGGVGVLRLSEGLEWEGGAGYSPLTGLNGTLGLRALQSPEAEWTHLFYGGVSYSRLRREEPRSVRDGGSTRGYSVDRPIDEPGVYQGVWLNGGWGFQRETPRGLRFEVAAGLTVGYADGFTRDRKVVVRDFRYYREKGPRSVVPFGTLVGFRIGLKPIGL